MSWYSDRQTRLVGVEEVDGSTHLAQGSLLPDARRRETFRAGSRLVRPSMRSLMTWCLSDSPLRYARVVVLIFLIDRGAEDVVLNLAVAHMD
jgi:hypothetical protein